MEEKLRKEYDDELDKFTSLADEVCFIIKQLLDNNKTKYHALTSRIKTYNSSITKIKRHSNSNSNLSLSSKSPSLKDLNDIVGVRIVCLFLDDVSLIQKYLEDSFEIISSDNKIENSSYSEFGYMSVHLICRLKKTYNGPRYDVIKELSFEIQIRTIAMDAWAAISHYMDYKQNIDIPSHLKKNFHALSGLLHVADLQFRQLYNSKLEFVNQMEKEIKEIKANQTLPINLDSLTAYLEDKFPDRQKSDSVELSRAILELEHFEIRSLAILDSLYQKHLAGVFQREKVNPPKKRGSLENTTFLQVGMLRMILEQEFGNDKLREALKKSESIG